MKKTYLILSFVALLAACQGKDQNGQNTDVTAGEPSNMTEETTDPVDSVLQELDEGSTELEQKSEELNREAEELLESI